MLKNLADSPLGAIPPNQKLHPTALRAAAEFRVGQTNTTTERTVRVRPPSLNTRSCVDATPTRGDTERRYKEHKMIRFFGRVGSSTRIPILFLALMTMAFLALVPSSGWAYKLECDKNNRYLVVRCNDGTHIPCYDGNVQVDCWQNVVAGGYARGCASHGGLDTNNNNDSGSSTEQVLLCYRVADGDEEVCDIVYGSCDVLIAPDDIQVESCSNYSDNGSQQPAKSICRLGREDGDAAGCSYSGAVLEPTNHPLGVPVSAIICLCALRVARRRIRTVRAQSFPARSTPPPEPGSPRTLPCSSPLYYRRNSGTPAELD